MNLGYFSEYFGRNQEFFSNFMCAGKSATEMKEINKNANPLQHVRNISNLTNSRCSIAFNWDTFFSIAINIKNIFVWPQSVSLSLLNIKFSILGSVSGGVTGIAKAFVKDQCVKIGALTCIVLTGAIVKITDEHLMEKGFSAKTRYLCDGIIGISLAVSFVALYLSPISTVINRIVVIAYFTNGICREIWKGLPRVNELSEEEVLNKYTFSIPNGVNVNVEIPTMFQGMDEQIRLSLFLEKVVARLKRENPNSGIDYECPISRSLIKIPVYEDVSGATAGTKISRYYNLEDLITTLRHTGANPFGNPAFFDQYTYNGKLHVKIKKAFYDELLENIQGDDEAERIVEEKIRTLSKDIPLPRVIDTARITLIKMNKIFHPIEQFEKKIAATLPFRIAAVVAAVFVNAILWIGGMRGTILLWNYGFEEILYPYVGMMYLEVYSAIANAAIPSALKITAYCVVEVFWALLWKLLIWPILLVIGCLPLMPAVHMQQRIINPLVKKLFSNRN